MAWANEEIAGLLPEYAELTQITGGDVFRARNYEKAARSVRGRLDGLAGFGARSGERIASGIEVYRQGRERVLLDVALHSATTLVAALSAVPGRGPR